MSNRSKIRTLRDMELLDGSNSSFVPSSHNHNNNNNNNNNTLHHVPDMKIAHIPNLPRADECLAMLRRIYREFYPISSRRGYSVVSLSEMCCCADGLDSGTVLLDGDENETTATATTVGTIINQNNNKRRRTRKRRKRKIMARNVLGYNQTSFHGSNNNRRATTHTIHLRLRQAHNHAILLPYEDVAGTMAHELAHCIHGTHDAKFYKLMDEIQEQHATYLIRGIVADNQGFPIQSNQAYTLGSGSGGSTAGKAAGAAAKAAQARRRAKTRWMPQGPQKLGGDTTWNKWYTPGEAAAAAAEIRRLEDEKWCLPCQTQQEDDDDDEEELPIELLSSSSEDEDHAKGDDDDDNHLTNTNHPIKVKIDMVNLPAFADGDNTKTSTAANDTVNCVTTIGSTMIDLTECDDENDEDMVENVPSTPIVTNIAWSCKKCTYSNLADPDMGATVRVCSMCGHDFASVKFIRQLTRDNALEQARQGREEAIRRAKEQEVEQAKRDFGFNIYGDCKNRSSTMKHLT